MSVWLRRSMTHAHPNGRASATHAEVLLVNASKVTSAAVAAAVDATAAADGSARSSPWVFHLDNGQRFEAHEVRVGDAWEPIDAERASAIVDGDAGAAVPGSPTDRRAKRPRGALPRTGEG